MLRSTRIGRLSAVVAALGLLIPIAVVGQEFTSGFDRERCNFTTAGSNPFFPLWPGYMLDFEGEEEDDEGELVEIALTITTLPDTELVDGVLTRVVEERELEDDELVEVSRNFFAVCRETGDVWYFGEDVDDYEDGEIVGHEGGWRAGVDGAAPGILMPGTPLLGARHFQENAPGIAQDIAEVISLDETLEVPLGTYQDVMKVEEGSALDPGDFSEKWYSPGLGLIKDEGLELVRITPPPCVPDAMTHCLSNGRFSVVADWADFEGNEGDANAILPSADSGEFWFFDAGNTELFVKVLDTCGVAGFDTFWVFAAGLTNVEVTIEVTDTVSGQVKEYESELGVPFEPVLDTAAFATCP